MVRYQIVKRLKGKDSKWEFVAHGARYSDKASANEMAGLVRSHGTHVVRLLALP